MKRFLLLLIFNFQLSIVHFLAAQTYRNPVHDWDFADPSIQRALDGTFYCYATGCQTLKSTDLVHWTGVSNVFNRPTWNDSTYTKDGKQQTDYYSLWASDVNYVGNRYVMYYASALWGNGSRTGIGVATGTTPYKFTDVGKLFRSTEIKVENSIDPVYIEEWDKKYLAWGSFNGIYITELSDDGLTVKDMSQIKKIAGTDFEGAMIHKHGNHYYLFASVGRCCEGLNSTYQTVVGRSTKLTGPYMAKSGGLMNSNSRTTILSKNSAWVGPGHNSEIVTDDEGQDWILYHGYDASDPDKGRVLLLDRLLWDEQGWPYVQGGGPSSTEQDAPIFHKGDGSRMNYRITNPDFMKSRMAGWTATSAKDVVLESGLGSIYCPLMHAAGGDFSVEQACNGVPDGCYEIRLQGYSTQGHAQIRVGSVLSPLLDGSALGELPATPEELSKSMLQGSYGQSAYGLVVDGKLTIGIMGNLSLDEDCWVGNVQLIRRDQNETAVQAIQPWYVQRTQQVLDNPKVDSYYKSRLEGYLQNLETATTASQQYSVLVNIHKQLGRLDALDPLYDSIESIHDGTADGVPANDKCYDLSGRQLSQKPSRGIYIQGNRKVTISNR